MPFLWSFLIRFFANVVLPDPVDPKIPMCLLMSLRSRWKADIGLSMYSTSPILRSPSHRPCAGGGSMILSSMSGLAWCGDEEVYQVFDLLFLPKIVFKEIHLP